MLEGEDGNEGGREEGEEGRDGGGKGRVMVGWDDARKMTRNVSSEERAR